MAPTRWTVVLRCRGQGDESRKALSELCEAYYTVVENFIRRETRNSEESRDLAHEFFARLLAGGGLAHADREKGRFRSYLFGAVKHFLSVERTHRARLKRGGGAEHVPLDLPGQDTNHAIQVADPGTPAPDMLFDRQWARTMLTHAMDRLAAEMAEAGKADQFEALKPFLQVGGTEPGAEAGTALGLNPAALKVAVHRLRKRFKVAVRQEIAETLHDPAMVEEELKHLLQVLREA